MNWVNTLALTGLAFVALPVLIHLLGRAPAKVMRFPSLRFLEASRLLSLKRTRIQDPLLMVLRALVLAFAALALAGPVFDRDNAAAERGLRAIAVVLDTSASVRRGSGLAAGGALADSVAGEATSGTEIRTARLSDAIDGAAAWLANQQGAREIALISDFQLGAIDAAELKRLPAGTRVSVRRVPVAAPATELAAVTMQGGTYVSARARQVSGVTEVTWVSAARDARQSFEVLAAPGEASDVALARRAAQVVGSATSSDTTRRVALVYLSYAGRAELQRSATPLDQPWQGEVVARLAAAGQSPLAASDGGRLLLFVDAPVASDASVSLQAALGRALAGPLDAAELETRTMDDAALATLAAVTTAPDTAASAIATNPTESPARRPFWIAALFLLAIEWVVRRAPRTEHAAG